MKRESRISLATLTLVLMTCTACAGGSRAVADTGNDYQAVSVDDEVTDVHEREKQLALDRLRLTQEFQLRELRARHTREIAELKASNMFEIERLKATHASETKTLTEAHEKAFSELKIQHQQQIDELTDQITMRERTAIATGSLAVISWITFGLYLRRRRTIDAEVVAAAAAWRAVPRASLSVVDQFHI